MIWFWIGIIALCIICDIISENPIIGTITVTIFTALAVVAVVAT